MRGLNEYEVFIADIALKPDVSLSVRKSTRVLLERNGNGVCLQCLRELPPEAQRCGPGDDLHNDRVGNPLALFQALSLTATSFAPPTSDAEPFNTGNRDD